MTQTFPPIGDPVAELVGERLARASRQLLLPGVGLDGQRRLAGARVLVIGAGGLGSPALQYLGGAGIGTIGIIDFDSVDLSNLQRQVIHRTASVGEAKTVSAARALKELDPGITVVQHPVRLDRGNALELFSGYDIIVDGSDNFATRYLASDAAAILTRPYVWGSVYRFDGQVTVFWEGAPDGRSLDYRDLHPVPPPPGDVLSCDEAGVLGAVCGTIGAMMATEVVKLVCGVGEILLGRVLTLDALGGQWGEARLGRRPGREPVTELIDYEAFCGVASADGPSIGVGQLTPSDVMLDVREPSEHALGNIPGDRLLPLRDLLDDPARAGSGPLVVYCKSGARSARAVEALRAVGVDAVSLRGGFDAWLSRMER